MAQQVLVPPIATGYIPAGSDLIGPSEEIIARNIARNFPEYNGQSIEEALSKFLAVISFAESTEAIEPPRIAGRPFYVPWNGYAKFSEAKKERIANRTLQLIAEVVRQAAGETRVEEWRFRVPGTFPPFYIQRPVVVTREPGTKRLITWHVYEPTQRRFFTFI